MGKGSRPGVGGVGFVRPGTRQVFAWTLGAEVHWYFYNRAYCRHSGGE